MRRVSARRTVKQGLCAVRLADMTTDRTGLRRVGGIDLQQRPRLVGQLAFQEPPVGLQDFPVEASFLLDVPARGISRPLGTAGHGLGVQVFDDHRVGRVRQRAAVLMGCGHPLAFLLAAQLGQLPADAPVRLDSGCPLRRERSRALLALRCLRLMLASRLKVSGTT